MHFLGFTPKVREVLAAGDLLVSPVRYEAYGLNVHEALCCGLAVMVTRTAGVVERFDAAMAPALLPDGVTADASRGSAARMARRRRWMALGAPRPRTAARRSWADMAAELVTVAQDPRAGAFRMTRTHRFLTGFVTGYAHLVLATIAGLWLTPFFLHHLGQSTYGLWLVGTQIIAYLLLLDLGIVALLPRETAYITGRTGRHDAPGAQAADREDADAGGGADAGRARRRRDRPLVAARSWAALRAPLAVALGLFVLTFPLRVFQAALTGLQDLAFVARAQLVAWTRRHARQRGAGPSGIQLSALAAGWCVTQAIIIAACAVRLATSSSRARCRAGSLRASWSARDYVVAFRLGFGQPDCPGAVERHRRDDRRRAARPRRGRALCLHRQAGVGAGESAPGDPAERCARTQRAPDDADRGRLFQVSAALAQATLAVSGLVACIVLAVNGGFVRWWVGPGSIRRHPLTLLLLAAMMIRHFNTTNVYALFASRTISGWR